MGLLFLDFLIFALAVVRRIKFIDSFRVGLLIHRLWIIIALGAFGRFTKDLFISFEIFRLDSLGLGAMLLLLPSRKRVHVTGRRAFALLIADSSFS